MVLVLLGLVIFSVLMGRNLSSYVKENLVVQVMLEQDVTNPEGLQMCKRLKARPYVKGLTYISKEQALQEATHDLGTNPSEFAGVNPFQPSIEITTQADYANNDSLKWIAKELKSYSRVTEVSYQHDLIEQVNNSLTKISIGLLIVAALLTFISFSLINNTVRLGIYARRFSIHTMKLVGASWGFIRKPFIKGCIGRCGCGFACRSFPRWMPLCLVASRAGTGQCARLAGACHHRRFGLPLRYHHYGSLCQYLGEQVPQDEGGRSLQDLIRSKLL